MKESPPAFKKVVIITGCSSGLGRALAERLIESQEFRVVVTARESSLFRVREVFTESADVLIREMDMLDDSSISRVVNDICRIWSRVDVVVNNAGICYRSVVEHMDFDAEMIQLRTNYLGPMSLIRAVLPIMREQRGGQIINVSSVSGMVSMPTMASYSASKHALEGASESLWYEARPFGIKVTLVEPGFINSDSFKKVLISKKAGLSIVLNGPHSEYYKSMTPFIEKLMRRTLASPEKVAKRIEKLIKQDNPPLRLPVTWDAVLFNLLRSYLPMRIFHKLMFLLLPGSGSWGHADAKSPPPKPQEPASPQIKPPEIHH